MQTCRDTLMFTTRVICFYKVSMATGFFAPPQKIIQRICFVFQNVEGQKFYKRSIGSPTVKQRLPKV